MTDAAIAKKRASIALAFDETRARSGVEASGSGEWCGVPIRWRRASDDAGNIVQTIDGALTCAAGVEAGADVGWQIDESGAHGPLDLANLEELIVTTAVADGRWVAEESPLAIELVSSDAAATVLAVRAHARAAVTYHLTIDGASGLPRRLVRLGRDDAHVRFDDFGPGPFGLVPRRTIVREGWLEDRFIVERIEQAEVRAPTLPTLVPCFNADVPLVARATRRRLPLVRASIDGTDAGWFLLDTGAGALALDAAFAVKLPGVGRRIVRTSTDIVGAPLRRARLLEVGPLSIPDPLFLELDLTAFGRALKVKLAGVLGYDVFRRAVVTIAGEHVELGAPSSANLTVPLRFEDRRPAVTLRLPGSKDDVIEGLFAIDTGASSAITIHAGAAALLAMRGGARASLRGIGGAGTGRARTLAWVELAGMRFEDVDAIVADGGSGVTGERAAAGSGRGIMGSIGMGLLHEVTMVLDYSAASSEGRAFFEKRPRPTFR